MNDGGSGAEPNRRGGYSLAVAVTEPSPPAERERKTAPRLAATTESRRRATITAGEAFLLGAVAIVAIVAWASLVLAHLRLHDLWTVAAVSALVLAGVALLVLRRKVRVVANRREAVALAALATISAVLFFPGFPYGLADKDPGVYVAHAFQIARTGSYDVTDPVLDLRGEIPYLNTSRGFPGIWIADLERDQIVPQFYHLFPATLATAVDAGGESVAMNTNPFLAVVAALALALAVTRAFGRLAGVLAGLLLATNMLEVWHAKSPLTEIPSQLFFVGALLGLVVALDTGWRPAAGLAGLLVALSFLVRPDGLLLVLLAAAAGAVLVAAGRFGALSRWFAVGLALPLPHALYQAYAVQDAYTLVNGVPSLTRIGAFVVALFAGAALARVIARTSIGRRVARFGAQAATPRARILAGIVITLVGGVLVALALVRPAITGPDVIEYHGRPIRSFAEQALHRLAWFFTLPGIVVAWLGLAVVAIGRWRAAAWALVLPGLVFVPLYVWNPRITPMLMWWSRRFVPVVVVVLIVLIAVALARALSYRGRFALVVRADAAVVAAFLVASFLAMSWPLRAHREYDGSFETARELDAVAGSGQGVFLWAPSARGIWAPGRNLGAFLWFRYGHITAPLTEEASKEVRVFARAFPDRPIFVLVDGDAPPPVKGLDVALVDRIVRVLPMWEITHEDRPDEPARTGYAISVYRVATR